MRFDECKFMIQRVDEILKHNVNEAKSFIIKNILVSIQ